MIGIAADFTDNDDNSSAVYSKMKLQGHDIIAAALAPKIMFLQSLSLLSANIFLI